MNNKATALITAQSIIAGFMFTYGALVGQMLIHWSEVPGASLFTTFLAGVLIYAIVLTSFVSVLLLYRSIDANDTSAYRAGYVLFIVAIVGSGFYVVLNVFSIYAFTVNFFTGPPPRPMPVSSSDTISWSTLSVIVFLCYVTCLVLVLVYYSRFGSWVLEKTIGSVRGRHRSPLGPLAP